MKQELRSREQMPDGMVTGTEQLLMESNPSSLGERKTCLNPIYQGG